MREIGVGKRRRRKQVQIGQNIIMKKKMVRDWTKYYHEKRCEFGQKRCQIGQ
jgi:hypothetical protein